jgi:(E)-4-hydroxy-3-methylbut-2-enyl-diphosphate synthase
LLKLKGKRKATRPVFVGPVQVGGGAPVVVQSMTSTDTRDVKATVRQAHRLIKAGCEIVRVAVPDREAAEAIGQIKKAISVPLIADIHFNHVLALEAMRSGADAIRINPGNIPQARLKEIIRTARERQLSIRIGVNSGSLEKELVKKYGGPTAEALAESALKSIDFFEGQGFTSIKLSLKSSEVPVMIDAYRLISAKTDYPLHLGVTEAGSLLQAAIKSSIGIGVLLNEGIGDTIRVSVTGDPVQEIPVAYGILRALGIRKVGPDIISCPTCGRCEVDVPGLVNRVEKALAGRKDYFKVALMGCVVNGPGEAAEADIGLAGGKGSGILFKKGKAVKKVAEKEFIQCLLQGINEMTSGREENGE